MAGFAPFNLGEVLQTAETIKGLRRQEGDDLLRRQYMQQQMASGQQQMDIQGAQFKQQQEQMLAKKQYYLANAVLSSADPKATAEAIAPDFIQQFEKQHGAGTWKSLSPEQAVQAANMVLQQATSVIGPQTKVKWIDSGGQQIAVDETTGQPLKGVAPIAKTASPDTLVSAQTSMRGQDLSAQTARAGHAITARGQDIGALTASRGQDIALRGQDMGSATAAAGRATTERGQDLTYQAQQQKQKSNPTAAWNTYNTAINQFKRDLGDTWYLGPGYEAVGQMLPDMTPARRVASGSRSNMAPVLKDVFRQAGEGTFTKDDQEVLLRMLPGVSDSPGARKAKFENLDAIVRSKLGVNGQQGGPPPAPQPGMVQDGYVYRGGDPANPQSWQKQ